MSESGEWSLGLSSWIIQDGNYGDFHRGQQIEVAVEFGFEKLELATEGEPSARLLDGSDYALNARVVHVESDVWVIDAGVTMFREAVPPPGIAIGDLVSGVAYVGVDPFFYFERLAKRESMPSLIHTWEIVAIERQTAPFIEAAPRVRVRDPERLGWTELEETDAWKDDDGNAEYVLRCRLSKAPARRTSATRL